MGAVGGRTDREPVQSVQEVMRRCQAADDLAKLGEAAHAAIPALLRTLVVDVEVDCGLVLRVSAAAAIWKVGGRMDVAMPTLAWALKDEYWGTAPKALEVLAEIGSAAVVPDLVALAQRRLDGGPFHDESLTAAAGSHPRPPLLALVASALGSCGRGQVDGRSLAPASRAMLSRLADHADERIRAAALAALERLAAVR